ncbi:hypothetical protein HDU96_000846, partial [Phlyctochytrium bullatum]
MFLAQQAKNCRVYAYGFFVLTPKIILVITRDDGYVDLLKHFIVSMPGIRLHSFDYFGLKKSKGRICTDEFESTHMSPENALFVSTPSAAYSYIPASSEFMNVLCLVWNAFQRTPKVTGALKVAVPLFEFFLIQKFIRNDAMFEFTLNHKMVVHYDLDALAKEDASELLKCDFAVLNWKATDAVAEAQAALDYV